MEIVKDKMFVWICFGLLVLAWSSGGMAKNLGHRLGGDYYEFLPENSLIVFEASLYGWENEDPIVSDKDFKYAEFDVQETYDGELVVFHDKDFKRMLPDSGFNSVVYDVLYDVVKDRFGKKIKTKDFEMKHVTYDELQNLRLKGGHDQTVPTLKEVLEMAIEADITKPLVVEIKYIHTHRGRQKLLEMVTNYNNSFGKTAHIIHNHDFPGERAIQFLAFTKKFKYSFPDTEAKNYFCDQIRDADLGGIYKAGKHEYNHCAKYVSREPASVPDEPEEPKETPRETKKKKKKWWQFWK